MLVLVFVNDFSNPFYADTSTWLITDNARAIVSSAPKWACAPEATLLVNTIPSILFHVLLTVNLNLIVNSLAVAL